METGVIVREGGDRKSAPDECEKKSGGWSLSRLAKVETVLLLVLYAGAALAQSTSSGSSTTMPWDTGLCDVANALLGKTSFCLALAGFFGCGGALIWGEELSGFAKKMLMVVMAVGVMVGGASLYKLLNSSGTTC